MKRTISTAAMLFWAVSAAQAANIPIVNPSFETDVLAKGKSTINTLSGWTGSSTTNTYFGVYNPTTVSYPGGVPDGSNVAYLLEVGPPVSISQTLTTVLRANDVYTLSFYVGLRSDTAVYAPGLGCYGFNVALMAGGNVLTTMILANGNISCSLVTIGTFTKISFTYSSGANPVGLGSPLQIVLSANGSGSGFEPGEIDFDNIVLTDTLPAIFTCTNTTAPVISFIDSADSYGGYPYFTSGSWLEIKGTNLADPADPRLTAATNPGQWTVSDFNGANAPTSLDGISVSINGKPAYVWYLSTGQINVQAPEDTALGNIAITVTNCKATSAPFTFARHALAPGLLAPSSFSANGTQYLVATFASDGAYVLNTSTGAALGLGSRPAKPGDLIIAYGIGFGDVTPSILPGVIVGQSNTLVNPVTISFGSTPAVIAYEGLVGNFVGLYEFYFTVPSVANGDYQIDVAQNGVAVPQTFYLTVHN